MKKYVTLNIILLFFIFLFATVQYFEKVKYNKNLSARVIDGDTLELSSGEKIRLIGIDCPELDDIEGRKTTQFVKSLVENNSVRVEFDVQKKDRYGRLLSYVFIAPKKDLDYLRIYKPATVYLDGREFWFLNALIIQAGYAQPVDMKPNIKYSRLFHGFYHQARIIQRGLWKDKSKIKILLDDQLCGSDNDCVLIENNCFDACECPNQPVNKSKQSKYERLLKDCRSILDSCDVDCIQVSVSCKNGKCSAE